VVDHLPSKHEALNSNPSTAKLKKKSLGDPHLNQWLGAVACAFHPCYPGKHKAQPSHKARLYLRYKYLRKGGWVGGGCVAQGLEGLPHKPESLSKVQDHIVADRERVRLLYTLEANSHRAVYGHRGCRGEGLVTVWIWISLAGRQSRREERRAQWVSLGWSSKIIGVYVVEM
jgi:hypothetical protein